MSINQVFLLFINFQFKHLIVDFMAQTKEQVDTKDIYGHPKGLEHSFQHGLATLFILLFYTSVTLATELAILDTIIHYHIDLWKMNFTEKDLNKKQFWIYLGIDQFLHQLTYIVLIFIF